jgi:hypothetical protein
MKKNNTLWSKLTGYFTPKEEELKYKEFLNAVLENPKVALPMLKQDPSLAKCFYDNLKYDRSFRILLLNKTSSKFLSDRYTTEEYKDFNKIQYASEAYVKSMLSFGEAGHNFGEDHVQILLGDEFYIGAKY